MLKTEMLVQFKEEYNGYFRDLKGKTLTVMQVFPADKRTLESEKVTLMEIEEIHLINASWLKEVNNETAN